MEPARASSAPEPPPPGEEEGREGALRPALRPRTEASASRAAEPNQPATSARSITVEIGRLEVRAAAEQPSAPTPRRQQFRPDTSLDDYLSRRRGGKG